MMTLEDRLIQVSLNSDIHRHEYVTDTYLDDCGQYHLAESELDEDENRRLVVRLPKEIIYCWRCSVMAESEDNITGG